MSTLSDKTILKMMKSKNLIDGGDESCIGSACYELRMGNVYYDLTENDKRIELKYNEKVIIKPGHRVVLITKESLNVPDNIVARVTSKGSLFSIGLSAVSTSADPGFSGQIGIVTQNFSDKYIEIPQNESIAKVDFSLLDEDSNKPYRGQHGFQTKVWPIKSQFQKTHKDLQGDDRVESEDIEAHKVLPKIISDSLRKIECQQKKINVGLVLFFLINLMLLAAISTKFFEPITAFLVNMCTSAVLWLYVQLTK